MEKNELTAKEFLIKKMEAIQQITEDLLDIHALMNMLGYSDERSVKKWCKSRQIPILILGLKKYILSHYLTQHIDNQFVIFEKRQKEGKKSEAENKKTEKKKKRVSKGSYQPDNELISKYLTKYESSDKSQPAKKR